MNIFDVAGMSVTAPATPQSPVQTPGVVNNPYNHPMAQRQVVSLPTELRPMEQDYRVEVVQLILLETGTYNDMYYRTYETRVNNQSLNILHEATRGGEVLQPSALAGVAGLFLKPTAAVTGANVAQAPNGFGQKRFRFMMKINYTTTLGSANTLVYTGFTDTFNFVSLNTNECDLPPEMRFHFNTAMVLRTDTVPTPSGPMAVNRMVEATHVINGAPQANLQYGMNGAPGMPVPTHTVRPEDVVWAMESNFLSQGMPTSTFDLRQGFSQGVLKKSHRSDNTAPNYMSKLLTGLREASTQDLNMVNYSDLIENAHSNVAAPLVQRDPFLSRLLEATGLVEGGFITWSELRGISPSVDRSEVTKVITERQLVRDYKSEGLYYDPSTRGSSAEWHGADNITVMATILQQAIPALMFDVAMLSTHIAATNQTVNGQFVVTVDTSRGFQGAIDLSREEMILRQRLVNEVLRDITQNGLIDINLDMRFNVLGDSEIWISVAGSPRYKYVTPSFMDGLLPPILTNNPNDIRLMGVNMEKITTAIGLDPSQHF